MWCGVLTPVQPVCHPVRCARQDVVGGAPIGNDIVVNLKVSGDFHQLHISTPPALSGCDPKARTPVIKRLKIVEIVKVPRALHQAKTARVGIAKRADLQRDRVGQRPPDHLARAVVDQQAIVIVHRRPEIVKALPVHVVKEEHGGQRRDTHMGQVGTRKNLGINLHHQRLTMGDLKAVGPGAAGAVQQRVQDDRGRAGRGCFQPEGREVGKLLAHGIAGLEREATGRQPVDIVSANAPEIAGPLEHGVFLKDARLAQFGAQPQAGIAQRIVDRHVRELVGAVKDAHVELQRPRGAILDHIGLDRLRKVEARGEHIDALGRVCSLPHGVAAVEPDLAILVICQVAPGFGNQRAGLIVTSRHRTRQLGDVGGVERLGVAQLQARFLSPSNARGCGQSGEAGKEFATQHQLCTFFQGLDLNQPAT
mmetsp:Transcript_23841/g.43123  ORF Transcript_23841/g.43123 Transcript_23841/m.43123 type:complete len:422 (+) Transcript_23841:375-1640(+)